MDRKKFLQLGVTRGLIAQVIGTALGIAIATGLRAILGMPVSFEMGSKDFEPAAVFGAIVGAFAFMLGVGVLSDWLKWARGIETHDHHGDAPGWEKYFGVSLDHKIIGIQYGYTSMAILLIAGSFALTFRSELAQSGLQVVNSGMVQEIRSVFTSVPEGTDLFNTLVGMHGILMIAAMLLGVGAMTNYLVPMMIGAQDMAFPRLNAFSYWINVPGAVLVLSSLFLGGFDTGWTGYPPLSARAPLGVQTFFWGVYFIGLSSIFGSLNLIVTVVRMRAKGMTMWRMPIFVWASFATALIQLTATQFIGLSFQMVSFQRMLGMGFFDPAVGGNPILFQHLFWFYSHPAVYVFILPGLGIISELLPVFARKPLFGYRWIAMSSLGIAAVGFLVWAHHMFTSGMEEYLRVPFMYSTLLVAVPTGVKFFSWVGTMWRGKMIFPTPMLFTIGAIIVFLFGGLTGPPNGTVSTDLHLHDTYWVVGHFHNTMFGGFIFPFFAAIYYWYPKMTGRKMDETLGKIHFWLMTPAFWVVTFGMMYVGLQGMRRRIADYDPAQGFDAIHTVITIAAFAIATSVLVFVINVIFSLKDGALAEGNVWRSRSPEWQVASPMPAHNYDRPFRVVGEPYDYGLPGSTYVDMNPAMAGDD